MKNTIPEELSIWRYRILKDIARHTTDLANAEKAVDDSSGYLAASQNYLAEFDAMFPDIETGRPDSNRERPAANQPPTAEV